jgi:hypothetical protein
VQIKYIKLIRQVLKMRKRNPTEELSGVTVEVSTLTHLCIKIEIDPAYCGDDLQLTLSDLASKCRSISEALKVQDATKGFSLAKDVPSVLSITGKMTGDIDGMLSAIRKEFGATSLTKPTNIEVDLIAQEPANPNKPKTYTFRVYCKQDESLPAPNALG